MNPDDACPVVVNAVSIPRFAHGACHALVCSWASPLQFLGCVRRRQSLQSRRSVFGICSTAPHPPSRTFSWRSEIMKSSIPNRSSWRRSHRLAIRVCLFLLGPSRTHSCSRRPAWTREEPIADRGQARPARRIVVPQQEEEVEYAWYGGVPNR